MVNTISLDCNFPNARMYASPSREVLRFFLTFTPPFFESRTVDQRKSFTISARDGRDSGDGGRQTTTTTTTT